MTTTILRKLRMKWVPVTLIGKGRLFITALLLYVSVAAFYLFSQKAELVEAFEQYNTLSRAESALVTGGLAITDAYNDLFFIVGNLSRDEIIEKVHQHFQSLLSHYQQISILFPEQATRFKDMTGVLAATVNLPNTENLLLLRSTLTENKSAIDQLVESNLALRTVTVEQLITRSNTLAVTALVLSIVGISGSGIVISIFFTGMAFNLRQLSSQLQQILKKQPASPIRIKRRDELGDVMQFSQQMGERLEQRDAELAIERQKRLHQERRAAIDHLLGGLIHELGNPIAAVSALTQNALYSAQDNERAQWEMLASYVDRMTAVLSDLNRLNLNSQDQLQLINLNEEIDRVLKLFKYDERWQQIKVSEVFEPNLSPIEGSSQTLQQLLTILLNFGMENLAGKTTAKLHIETYFIDDRPAFKMSSTAWFSEEALRLITSEQLQWSGISETEFDLVVSRYLAESVGYSLDIITDGEQQTLQLSSMPSDKKAMRSPE